MSDRDEFGADMTDQMAARFDNDESNENDVL